jgi:recombinational DNA repair ATPase RecF
MSQLNLELLDKALRERETYLAQRKERELQKLDEQFEATGKDPSVERERIAKWMDHEIRSVVHTRHQLWKGFNIARNIIENNEDSSFCSKKGDMMRCLSEKHLKHTSSKRRGKEEKPKEEVRKEAEVSDKDSEGELGKGRVTSVEAGRQQVLLR